MSIKGKELRKEFSTLFNKQKRKEESAQIQKAEKIFFEQKQYRKLNLKPKKPIDSLSPLFQDPDLLVEITGGNVQFLTGRSILSRRRNVLDSKTTVRPQAKDVSSKRVHEDEDLSTTNSVEEGYYYHPKGPKKRVYIAETAADASSTGGGGLDASTPASSNDSTTQAVYTVAPRLSELALPTHSITTLQQDSQTTQVEEEEEEEEEENPVLKLGTFLKSTADLLRHSKLDTIKYDGFYRLLPRLTPIKQYKNTNQQYNNASSEYQPQDDTVLTVTVFSEMDKHMRMQEIEILGSQSLRQLRKAIICPFGYGRNYHHYYQHLHHHTQENQNVMETDQPSEDGQTDGQTEMQQDMEQSEETNDENNQEQDIEDSQEEVHEDHQEQVDGSQEIHREGSEERDDEDMPERDQEDMQGKDQGNEQEEDDTQEDNEEQTQKPNQESDFDFHTLFSADENSLFFVENTIYTDSKYPRLVEKIITEWLSGKTQKQPTDFNINKKGIRLENVGFELNKPYCFIHYGKCEHMFVISDIRLLSAMDNVKELPRTLSSLKYTRYKCSMCSIFPATHLTTNDILTGFSPCYFCSVCYQSFHANIESETHMEGFESRLYYGDIP